MRRFFPRLVWTSRIKSFSSQNYERMAESELGDAHKQFLFYRSLNDSGQHMRVISRFESSPAIKDEACAREYVRALHSTGQLERASFIRLPSVLSINAPGVRNSSTSYQSPPDSPLLGTQQNPVKITYSRRIMKGDFRQYYSLLFWLLFLPGVYILSKNYWKPAPKEDPKFKEVESSTVRFADVKGCNEAKEEVQEVVAFLKDSARFTKLGGKLPKGILLTGPPGTGKTLLAKAIAGEAGVPFLYCAGSEFEEILVGIGARRMRDLFQAARAKAPCIVFIDEIDAIGGKRQERSASATLNQLLVEVDGFAASEGIVLIGATNFAESLDKALLRPGRFDRQVRVGLPDVRGRKEILELYVKDLKLAPDVDISALARGTPGCSGADIFNLINSGYDRWVHFRKYGLILYRL